MPSAGSERSLGSLPHKESSQSSQCRVGFTLRPRPRRRRLAPRPRLRPLNSAVNASVDAAWDPAGGRAGGMVPVCGWPLFHLPFAIFSSFQSLIPVQVVRSIRKSARSCVREYGISSTAAGGLERPDNRLICRGAAKLPGLPGTPSAGNRIRVRISMQGNNMCGQSARGAFTCRVAKILLMRQLVHLHDGGRRRTLAQGRGQALAGICRGLGAAVRDRVALRRSLYGR